LIARVAESRSPRTLRFKSREGAGRRLFFVSAIGTPIWRPARPVVESA
jgi:hypothetical protein